MRALLAILLLAGLAGAQGSLDELLGKADADDWQTRWSAVRGLARLPAGDHVFKLRSLLRRDERPRVRAAIAWACLLDKDLGLAILLGKALTEDPDPRVRRAAARALVHFKSRRSVAALIAALAKETDARARLHIVETLRSLTPAPCLLDAAAWRAWWAKHKGDPRFVPADQERKKADYDGIVLETKTVAVVRPKGDKAKREPPHVLVLPGFGWSTEMFGPYLLPLRERADISWVSLPSVQQLTGASGYGQDIAKYPVGRLVRSLDKFRRSLKLERFVILAPGASGWIAMRYAQAYPTHCAGLILFDTALDKKAYAAALQRAAARGTAGEKFTARTLLHQNSVPFNRATLDKIHRLGVERGFFDRSDLEIAELYHFAREPQGFASVPDINWSKRARLNVPALFLYSGHSAFAGQADAMRISKHFPKSLVAPIKEIRAMPWVEKNDQVHRVIADWLRRYELVD